MTKNSRSARCDKSLAKPTNSPIPFFWRVAADNTYAQPIADPFIGDVERIEVHHIVEPEASGLLVEKLMGCIGVGDYEISLRQEAAHDRTRVETAVAKKLDEVVICGHDLTNMDNAWNAGTPRRDQRLHESDGIDVHEVDAATGKKIRETRDRLFVDRARRTSPPIGKDPNLARMLGNQRQVTIVRLGQYARNVVPVAVDRGEYVQEASFGSVQLGTCQVANKRNMRFSAARQCHQQGQAMRLAIGRERFESAALLPLKARPQCRANIGPKSKMKSPYLESGAVERNRTSTS